MKKIFTILAFIASLFAVIFSVLPISNLAVIPAILSLAFGIFAFYLSKKTGRVKKIIQFSFLLTIMALVLTTYKAIFTQTKVENTEALQETEIKLEEEAIEELEGLDIEEIDLEELDAETIEIEDNELEELDIDASEIENSTIEEVNFEDVEINAEDLEDIEIE